MSKETHTLDRIDRQILRILQKDGRISNVALAKQVNLTATPCLERVKRLERSGYISEYIALLDPRKLNLDLLAYIQVTLVNTATRDLQAFASRMRALAEVQECHMVAGGFDFILKIRVANMEGYHLFLGEKLAAIPEVSQSHTYFVIQELKSETSLPV